MKVTRDDCNNQIIAGRRGQLYFDGPELCLMVLDGAPGSARNGKSCAAISGMGDISPHPKTGKRVQDVKISGIPLENARLAIRMVRAKTKRVLSEEQRAKLAAVGESSRFGAKVAPHTAGATPSPEVMVRGGETSAEGKTAL